MRPHKRWTQEEEDYVLSVLKKYKSVSQLPLVAMSEKLGRTADSIRRKAIRLDQTPSEEYEWAKEESSEAFILYLEELPLAKVLEKLHEQGSTASMEQLEEEIQRIRDQWSLHIKRYAETNGIPCAKHFKLDTIKFYIQNRNTASDFVKKSLHRKIKNG